MLVLFGFGQKCSFWCIPNYFESYLTQRRIRLLVFETSSLSPNGRAGSVALSHFVQTLWPRNQSHPCLLQIPWHCSSSSLIAEQTGQKSKTVNMADCFLKMHLDCRSQHCVLCTTIDPNVTERRLTNGSTAGFSSSEL